MVLQTSGTITHRNIANEFLIPQNQVRGLSNSFSFSSDTYVPPAPVIPAKGQFRSESYYYGKQNAPEWAIGSTYQVSGATSIQTVACDPGNNVFVGGYFTGILTLFNFDGTRSNVYVAAGTQDAFVAKYSSPPTSNVLWAARMTSTGNDAVLGISTDAEGNVYATGYYTGLMNLYSSSNTYVSNLAQYGGQDVFIVKYGPSGEVQWGARAGSSGTDVATGLSVDSSGSVYVTGYYNGAMYLYNSSNVLFTSQGNPGGNGTGVTAGAGANYGGGGGGGAGQVGNNAVVLLSGLGDAGKGGDGLQYGISGTLTYYGGGGGGAISSSGNIAGTGGIGGGGAGGKGVEGTTGTNNLGGGGGGSGGGGGVPSGAGGNGLVIMSYTTGTLSATGGTMTTNSGNTIHTYTVTGSNTFVVTSGGNINIIAVAGGGSGGNLAGGGGGAGGVVYRESISVTTITYTVVVGAGGPAVSVSGAAGIIGDPSYFSPSVPFLYAQGGGGGGGQTFPSTPGGSGGGGGFNINLSLYFGNVSVVSQLLQVGGQDVFIIKYDTNGNAIWAGRAGSSGADSGTGVATDAAGNVLVTGYYTGLMNLYNSSSQFVSNLAQYGGQDVFIAKYDTNGQVLWGARAGSSGTDSGNAVASDPSGNVFVTGYYNGVMSLIGTNTAIQYSTSNMAFVYPPAPMTAATTVSALPTGSYIASASNFFAGNDPYRAFNYYDPTGGWVSSTASYAATTGAYNGVLSTTINGSPYLGEWLQIQMPTQVSLTAYKIVNTDTVPTRNPKTWKLAGSNNGTTFVEIDSKTNSAPISGAIITLAPSANTSAAYSYFRIVSNVVVGTTAASYVTITELSLYSNVGYKYPFLNQTQAFTSGQDAFLAKYDPNGNILWGARGVSAGTDSGNGIATDSTGNVYMSGIYTGALYLIGNTYVSSSNVSAFVYPPYVMTAAASTFPEGTYTASASTNLANEDPFRAFNKSNTIPGWTTSTASYAATTGTYSGAVSTTINGSAYLGEWLQLQMPRQIVLNSYYLTSNQASNVSQTSDVRTPKSWKIAGSVDATNWVELDSQTSVPTGLITVPSNSNTTVGYSYFRMAVNQIKGALTTQFCSIAEMYLFSNTGQTSNVLPQISGQDVFVAKYGPSGDVLWGANSSSTGTDIINGMALNSQGNVYVTGTISTNVPITTYASNGVSIPNTILPPGTTQYGFIENLTPSGNVVGTTMLGTLPTPSYNVTSVCYDKTGNIYATGGYTGYLQLYNSDGKFQTTGFVSNAVQSAFLAKYTSNGNVIWSAPLQSTGTSVGNGVAADAAGNVFVTGNYTGPMRLYNSTGTALANTLAQYGGQDVFIVKYRPSGEVLWGARTGSPGADAGNGIATDAAGNVFVTGYYTGLMNIYSSSNTYVSNLVQYGGQDVFLVKYGPSGEVRWGAYMGSPGADSGTSVATDVTGNVYVTGYYTGLMNIYSSSNTYVSNLAQYGGQDVFLVKYDTNGQVLWGARTGSAGTDAATALATDVAGNVYVTGYYAGLMNIYSSSDVYVSNLSQYGGQDVFLIKYGPSGQVQWGARTGSPGTDAGNGVAVDVTGNVYMTGYYAGLMNLYSSSNVYVSNLAQIGGQDVFVSQYDMNGNVLSAARAGSSGTDTSTCIACDPTRFNTVCFGGTMGAASTFYKPQINTIVKNYMTFSTGYTSLLTFPVNPPTPYWSLGLKTSGVTDTETITSSTVDTSGNVFVAGYFTGSSIGFFPNVYVSYNSDGTVTSNTYNQTPVNQNAFLTKYNSTGTVLWSATLESATGTSAVNGISADSAGNVFVTGYYTGLMNLYSSSKTYVSNLAPYGGQDVFIVKYGPSGEVRWGARTGSPGTDTGNSVSTDLSGNVYVTGNYNGLMNIYSSSNVYVSNLAQYGGQDVFLVKYGPSGEVLWGARTGSPGTDAGNGVAADSSGNVFVTGNYAGLMSILNSNTARQSNVSNVSAFLIPPIPMTTGTTTSALPLGSYISSASTNAPAEDPWKAFDKSNVSNGWTTSTASYAAITGTYAGATSTTINGSPYLGEWLQLQAPTVTTVTSYYLTSFQSSNVQQAQDVRTPKSWKLAGSTNGTTWIELDSQTSVPTGIITLPSNSNTVTSYNYFRIAVNQIKGAATTQYCSIMELYLYSNIGYTYPYLAQYGGTDVFLAKYDPSGQALWGATMGSSGTDVGYGVATDAAGNVFVTGYYTGLMNIYSSSNVYVSNLAQISGLDVFLVKYGPSGEVRWGARAGSGGLDIGNGVATDLYGNVYVTGQYSGQMNFYDSSGVSAIKQIQGNIGGTFYDASGFLRSCAGGGGGAGTVGGNGVAGFGGAGGNGLQYAISGTPTYYGGGGGGSVYGGASGGTGDVGGTGGLGGGGAGGNGSGGTNGVQGTDGLGGGGGGSSQNFTTNSSGRGGNGAVIISYATGTLSATGGTMTTAGGNTIHTYTVSGSNTFVVTSRGIVNTLVVGGGGSGGAVVAGYPGGGGGAGGVVYKESVFVPAGTYPVTVGTGAAAYTAVAPVGNGTGLAGSPSIFLNIVAGGGGGGNINVAGPSGASSGGGSFSAPAAITTYNAMSQIGGQDVFIAKYGISGEILWYTAAGSSGSELGRSVATDPTGNVYVTGTYLGIMNLYSSANTYVSNLALLGTTQCGFLVKYDQFGFVKNTNRSGSTAASGGAVSIRSISTSQSNIYVTGIMSGLSNFYNSNNAISTTQSVLTQDVFVAKYSQTGNMYWISKLTSTGTDTAVGISTDLQGNAYVNGTYTGPLTIYNSSGSAFSNVLPQVGGSDAFLVKYDTNGNVIWAAYQGSTGTDAASGIGTDSSGNVYTVGSYTGTMNIYSSSNVSFSNTLAQINANQCVFVAKYSPGGEVLWCARSGMVNATSSTMNRIFVESSGNVYVGGSGTNGSYILYNSNTSPAIQAGGSSTATNGFAFKYDPNGNAKWLMYITNAANGNNILSITGDNLGNIYIYGVLTVSGSSLFSTTFDSSTISLPANIYGGIVLKMNSNGSILNAARLSTGSGQSMVCDSGGFVYIMFNANAAYTFYDYTGGTSSANSPVGLGDTFISKMNPLYGNVVWTTRAGVSGSSISGTFNTIDSTGTIIIYGGTYPNLTTNFYDTSLSRIYSSQTSLGSSANSFLTRFPLV